MDAPSSSTAVSWDLTGRITLESRTPLFTGYYSFVFRGTVDGEMAAVKVLRSRYTDLESMKRKLFREIAIWAAANHENILPFSGFADDEEFRPLVALISPWCRLGNAESFLRENGTAMAVSKRIDLWEGVINGVAYLHSCNPIIVHGDLKPGNILIDDSRRPRICDFGLSRVLQTEGNSGMTTTSDHTGTDRYLAPELITETEAYPTTSSDVYALGCIGLEIIYLKKPYDHRVNNFRGNIILDKRRGLPPAATPPMEGLLLHRIWPLLQGCWERDPTSRPSASHVAEWVVQASLLRGLEGVMGQFSGDGENRTRTPPTKREKYLIGNMFKGTSLQHIPQDLTGLVEVDKDEVMKDGAYASIYLGMYNDQLVAVKIIKLLGNVKIESMKRKVKRETAIWTTLKHQNIHPFLGFGDDQPFGQIGALVSPWCRNGDAGCYLGTCGKDMPVNQRILLWKGVMDGVTYLHTAIDEDKPVIIHGDLKPGNVLIDDSGNPRICDFGLSQIFLEEGHSGMTTTSDHTGTERYLAPELLGDENTPPTIASDVYAVGCLGLDFVFLQQPFHNRIHNRRGQIVADIKSGVPPAYEQPAGSPAIGIWPLLMALWNSSPMLRPSLAVAAHHVLEYLSDPDGDEDGVLVSSEMLEGYNSS